MGGPSVLSRPLWAAFIRTSGEKQTGRNQSSDQPASVKAEETSSSSHPLLAAPAGGAGGGGVGGVGGGRALQDRTRRPWSWLSGSGLRLGLGLESGFGSGISPG